MDGFAWTMIGSVAGVVGAAAAIVFGLVPLLAARRRAGAAHSGATPRYPDVRATSQFNDLKLLKSMVLGYRSGRG